MYVLLLSSRGKNMKKIFAILMLCFFITSVSTLASEEKFRFINIAAITKQDRSAIADLGISIETVLTGNVWAFANEKQIQNLRKADFKILGSFDPSVAKGGHQTFFGFPSED